MRTGTKDVDDVAGIDLKVNPRGWGTGAITSTVWEDQSVFLGEWELIRPRLLSLASSPVDEYHGLTLAVNRTVQHHQTIMNGA